jgi:23S rRNA (uridine2552-2'-O)-methyltransferase
MSPDISGNYSIDHAKSIFLSNQAFETSKILLKPGGNFVCKVFSGEEIENFVKNIKTHFKTVKRFSPVASRKSSSEEYVIAKYFF